MELYRIWEANISHERSEYIAERRKYWLEILYKVNSLQEDVYNELNNKSGTLRRKLISSITTAKKNQSKGD